MCLREGYSLVNKYGRQRVLRLKGGLRRVLKYVWRDTLDDIFRRPTPRRTRRALPSVRRRLFRE